MHRHIGALILFWILSGCASMQSFSNCDVNSGTGLPIVHPDAFSVHLITSQHITITSQQHEFDFIGQLEISADKLILVAITPLGQKLFQIEYQKGVIEYKSFGIPDVFEPAYLLTDISLVYSSSDVLETCATQTRVPLLISQATAQKRIIQLSGVPVEISYSDSRRWQSEITLTNKSRGYTISIKPLNVEFL